MKYCSWNIWMKIATRFFKLQVLAYLLSDNLLKVDFALALLFWYVFSNSFKQLIFHVVSDYMTKIIIRKHIFIFSITWVLSLYFTKCLINLVLNIFNALMHENMEKCCETGDWRHLLVAQMHYVKGFYNNSYYFENGELNGCWWTVQL